MSALATKRAETLLHLCGEMLTPLPEGGLWWASEKLLVVSDLHLEKGSSYARRGQLLPPYDTSATLTIVESLVSALRPKTVLSLGDSFHNPLAEGRLCKHDTARIRQLTCSVDWVWVEGNHDPDPPEHLGGSASKEVRMGRLVFRHEPTGERGEIAGHLHPCARLISRVRSVRRRCFVTDGERLIMPALGTYTGGLNVLDKAYDDVFEQKGRLVFMITPDAVIPVAHKRLIPDGPRSDLGRWKL